MSVIIKYGPFCSVTHNYAEKLNTFAKIKKINFYHAATSSYCSRILKAKWI